MAPSGNTIWMNPKEIAVNPENCRDHGADQDEVVTSLIEKYGFLKPLLYNSRLDRLVDGHERLALAIQQDWSHVPVWVIDVDEQEEAEIIIALEESGRMGIWNPRRTQALIDKAGTASDAVKKLIDDLSKREGLAAYIERTSSPEPTRFATETTPDGSIDPGIAARAMASEPPSISASKIRLVQLFVDADRLDLFNEWVEDLQEMWGVDSVTDAVMRTLSDAHLAYLRGGRRRRS